MSVLQDVAGRYAVSADKAARDDEAWTGLYARLAAFSVIGGLVFLNCLEDEVWIDASVRCVALHSVAFLKRCPCVHTR